MHKLMRLTPNGFESVEASLATRLAVADSFLVEDGRVRSIQAHFERFARGVGLLSPAELDRLPTFFDLIRQVVPLTGRWWPRLELHENLEVGRQLHLQLREAPAALGASVLWTYPERDARSNPSIKGPDLTYGAELRNKAQLLGADEAVLTDERGYLIEGALSSIVWWRNDVLCAPNNETSWLDSITRQDVFAIAKQMGLATREEHVKPADLVDTEVWQLGALQGIRPVSEWIDLGGPLRPATHLDAFVRRMKLLAAPIR